MAVERHHTHCRVREAHPAAERRPVDHARRSRRRGHVHVRRIQPGRGPSHRQPGGEEQNGNHQRAARPNRAGLRVGGHELQRGVGSERETDRCMEEK